MEYASRLSSAVGQRSAAAPPHLQIDAAGFQDAFDREPLPFSHNLSAHELFSDSALRELARRYDSQPDDCFVAAGAASPDSEFFGVPNGMCKPSEALRRLPTDSIRLLLKRPENLDPGFRRLLDEQFAEVMALRGGLQGAEVAAQ